jgi:hypothetical protein
MIEIELKPKYESTSGSTNEGDNPANGIAYRRLPERCFDQVFRFKLGRFTLLQRTFVKSTLPLLKLKTRPRFCPVRLSLSMVAVIDSMHAQVLP